MKNRKRPAPGRREKESFVKAGQKTARNTAGNSARPAEQAREEELIGGRQAVIEALRHGKPRRIYVAENSRGEIIRELQELAAERKVPLAKVSAEEFSELTGDLPAARGVAALVPPFAYLALDELIRKAQQESEQPLLVMLDHIEDPQNLGAVMRTADAAGLQGLVIPERRAAGVTAAVRRVSAGAAERLPVARVGNLNQAAEKLKGEGFWLYGAEADGTEHFCRADYSRPLVLVMGGEDSGLSRLLRENCDQTLKIPMPGPAGSLNVAAAAAVLIYAALAGRGGWCR